MKRVFALILTVCILLTAFVFPVYAQENDWQDKLDDALKNRISEAADDDIISVTIRVTDIDTDEADRRIVEATGYTRSELKDFSTFRQSSIEHRDDIDKGNEILAEMYEAHISTILQGLGITDIRYMSDGIYRFNYPRTDAYAIVCVRCDQIPGIAQSTDVISIFDRPLVKATEGKEFLYADLFLGQYLAMYGLDTDWLQYDELYYHKDENGEIDWALIYADTFISAPWIFSTVICHRVIKRDGWAEPFTTGYALYDAVKNEFFDVNNENMNNRDFYPDDYPDYVKVFDEYATYTRGDDGFNRLLGDIDNDGEIAVIDVTMIQRCEAELSDYPEDDGPISFDSYSKTNPAYFSDFNCDKERDILDATCIQRYLVDIA